MKESSEAEVNSGNENKKIKKSGKVEPAM